MPPLDSLLHGVDVSRWQGQVDWRTAAASGMCEFAYAKATEGATLTDERFAENWGGTLYAGVPRGAYHFLTAADPAAQARHFLAVYPGDGELPPALDLEWGPDGGAPSAASAAEWLRIVFEEAGVRPVVYTSPAFARLYLRGPEGASIAAVHELWVAHYRVAAPAVPAGWPTWRLWQTGIGRVPGFAGPVDVDVKKPTI